MEEGHSAEGWTALSDVSNFMVHVEKRKLLSIFGELDAELDYLQYLIRTQIHKADEVKFKQKKRKKQLAQDLVRALKTLKKQELIYYYNLLVQQIIALINNNLSPPIIQNTSFLIIQSYTRSYNLRLWKKKKLRFDRQNHIIYAQKDKKIKIYDLTNYIVRTSNISDYLCIVLQAINDKPLQKSKTVHIGFQYKNSFNLWHQSVKLSISYRQWERLCKILGKTQLAQQNLQKISGHIKNKAHSEYHAANKDSSFLSQNIAKYQSAHSLAQMPRNNINKSQYDIDSSNFTINELGNSNNAMHPCTISTQFRNDVSIQKSKQLKLNLEQVKKNSYIHRLIYSKLNMTLEQLQCQLQKQSQYLKQVKNKVKLYNIPLQNYRLDCISDTLNFKEIGLQFDQKYKYVGEISIYQNIENHFNFKLIYKSPPENSKLNIKKQTLLQYFLDPKLAIYLNKSISSIEIKAVIYSQNLTINMEQHQPYNRLYRPREFLYIRHLTKNSIGQYFIIDKSIQQKMFVEQNMHYVKGSLFIIIKISQQNGQIMIVVDLTIRNQGELLQQQEIKHSKKYMNHLALGLSQFFSKEHGKDIKIKLYNNQIITCIDSQFVDPSQETYNQESLSLNSSNVLMQEPFSIKDISFNDKVQDTSFYQIPRVNLHLQKGNMADYMYIGQEDQIAAQLQEQNKARQVNKKYLLKNICSFDTIDKSKEDLKIEKLPAWAIQWEINDQNGGLVHKINNSKQKQTLKQILQYAIKITLAGKSNSVLSFPVDVHAPESYLQRSIKALSYAPSLFNENHSINIMQRFKKTVIFGLLTTLQSISARKAFNPVLGQTYQSSIPNCCFGYAEQISTKPALSALYLKGKYYQISALIESKLKIMMNSVRGENEGVYRVKFIDEQQICFTIPPRQISGLVFNNCAFSLLERSYYWIQDKSIILQLNFEVNHSFSTSAQSKMDYFEGFIYQVKPQFMKDFIKCRKKVQQKDIIRMVEKVSGRWTKYITFGRQTTYFENIVLYQMINDESSLPSDCTFRQDINQLKLGNMQLSQIKKQKLQELERADERRRC